MYEEHDMVLPNVIKVKTGKLHRKSFGRQMRNMLPATIYVCRYVTLEKIINLGS